MSSKIWSTYAGAVAGGALASACCIGPLIIGFLGVGSAGFASFLEPYRPYLLTLTVILLGGAFYMTYRKRPANACAADGTCHSSGPSRRQTGLLWMITVITLAAASYPYWIRAGTNPVEAVEEAGFSATASTLTKELQRTHDELSVVLGITGMTCSGCAHHVQNALQEIPGVQDAEVSYQNGAARLQLSKPVAREALIQAVAAAGYIATVTPTPKNAKKTSSKKQAQEVSEGK